MCKRHREREKDRETCLIEISKCGCLFLVDCGVDGEKDEVDQGFAPVQSFAGHTIHCRLRYVFKSQLMQARQSVRHCFLKRRDATRRCSYRRTFYNQLYM